jgi:hypothetical protein
MSIEYCNKHHKFYDTDFDLECTKCIDKDNYDNMILPE